MEALPREVVLEKSDGASLERRKSARSLVSLPAGRAVFVTSFFVGVVFEYGAKGSSEGVVDVFSRRGLDLDCRRFELNAVERRAPGARNCWSSASWFEPARLRKFFWRKERFLGGAGAGRGAGSFQEGGGSEFKRSAIQRPLDR